MRIDFEVRPYLNCSRPDASPMICNMYYVLIGAKRLRLQLANYLKRNRKKEVEYWHTFN